MSTDERELVKAQAAARGLSVAAYVLTLVENDARSVSLCAHPETASVPGNNSTKAEGPRRLDEVPHAKAGRAVAAAAG